MNKLLIFILLPLTCLATAGRESDHFEAEFWQNSDGSYTIVIDDDGIKHKYFTYEIYHSSDCQHCNDPQK